MASYYTLLVAGAISAVMAGIAVRRTASLPLAYARPSTFFSSGKKKDVDARDEPGHDVERFAFRH
jgi:hypothetical protein